MHQMAQRCAELRRLPPTPALPGPSKGSPALPKLLSHPKFSQIIHQELAVPERALPQNEPTFNAIYSAAIIDTRIYIYLFCFMPGCQAGGGMHRQSTGRAVGRGVQGMSLCVGQECACNVRARWESTCMRQEECTQRAPLKQERACTRGCLCKMCKQSACKNGAATCMQGVSADLKCNHKAQICAKGKKLFAGGKMLAPRLRAPLACCVTCCPCSPLLLVSHSFCRTVMQCMGPQASQSS